MNTAASPQAKGQMAEGRNPKPVGRATPFQLYRLAQAGMLQLVPQGGAEPISREVAEAAVAVAFERLGIEPRPRGERTTRKAVRRAVGDGWKPESGVLNPAQFRS
jgi:hypothetical protein